jgi:geranylgeranyl pyrophosphate synthase
MATRESSGDLAAALRLFLDARSPQVESALSENLPPAVERPPSLHGAMRAAALSGGKRVRPLLVLATAELLCKGKKPVERVLPFACAIEYVHTCSLVLDDLPCMDDALLRRGEKTLHRATSESTAILAANALLMRAFELVAATARSSALARGEAEGLVAGLAATVGSRGMIGGQFVDLEENPSRGGEPGGLDRLEYVHARKTGCLFTYALGGAAALARANTAEREALVAYAKNVGLAFQIVDDVLDAEGDPAEMGKDSRKDGAKGRETFVSLSSVAEAKSIAADLIETAKASLALFRGRAAVLSGFADYVRDRRR